MGVLIQAAEQRGLVNTEYPKGFFPFFNGNLGVTPEPSYYPLVLAAASPIKTIEIDFNYHIASITPYETIWSTGDGVNRLELLITDLGVLELYTFDGTSRSIHVSNKTWKQWSYVKLRIEFDPLTIVMYDVSVVGQKINLGTITVTWNPSWTYAGLAAVGALASGVNYIRGWKGFIGTVNMGYFDPLQDTSHNMLTENNLGNILDITRTFSPRNNYPSTRTQIFVLDTLNNETITSVRQSANINEPGKIKSNYTQSFALPFSKVNNKFFAHCYDVNVTSDFFNIYKRTGIVVFDTAGTVIVSGVMMMNSIDQRNQVYNVTIYGEATGLYESLQDKLLTDLSAEFWDNYDHLNTRVNIENSWNGAAVNLNGETIPALFYPMEGYGKPNPNPDFQSTGLNSAYIQDWRPSLQVKVLFDQIMKEGGYNYNSEFLGGIDKDGNSQIGDTAFTDLYLGLAPLKNLSIQSKTYYYVSVDNLSGVVKPDMSSKGETYHPFVFKGIPVSETDPDLAWDSATGLYTPLQSGALEFGFSWVISSSTLSELTSTPTFQVTLTDTNGNNSEINSNNLPNETLTFLGNVGDLDAAGVKTSTIYVRAGVAFAFKVAVGGVPTLQSDEIILGFGFATKRMTGVTVVDQARSESMYGITLKQQQLLTGLTTMFNLIWDEVDSNTFKIEPFEPWLEDGDEVDWTEKIDEGGLISNNINNRKRFIDFKYSKSPDALITRATIERGIPPNSGRFQPNNTDWLHDGEEIIVPWIAPFLEQAGIADIFMPMRYEVDENGLFASINGRHIMGYKTGYTIPDSNLFQAFDLSDGTWRGFDAIRTLSPYKTIPLTTETKTLEFNLYGNAVNHIVGRTPTNLFKNIAYGSLMREYWNAWFNETYSDNAKIYKARFALDPTDAKIKMNTKIFIRDAYYRINKMTNRINADALTEVELIKIVDFDLNKFIAWNCELFFDRVENDIVIFKDELGSETFGTKDCCQAANGLWYSEPIDVGNVPAGEFRCYSSASQNSVFGVPGGSVVNPGEGFQCMKDLAGNEVMVKDALVGDKIDGGWTYCDDGLMCIKEIANPDNVITIDKTDLCAWLNLDWEPCEDSPWCVLHNGNPKNVNSLAGLKIHICNHGDTFGCH